MVRVAMVVSTVGYHWEEVFAAYWAFKDADYEIDLFTVDGKPTRADPMSLKKTGPLSLFGLGISSRIAPSTEKGQLLTKQLEENIRPLSDLDTARFDALYLPGGHGCLFDVNRDEGLHRVIAKMYDEGKVLSAVCHATSTFSFVRRDKKGKSIVDGHAMTGFPHPMDQALIAGKLVDEAFLPLPLINDEELRKGGANHSVLDIALAMANPRHMVISLPFITGVGPKAAGAVAREVIGCLSAVARARDPLPA